MMLGIQGTTVMRGNVTSVNQIIALSKRRLKRVSKERMNILRPDLGPDSAIGLCPPCHDPEE